MNKATRALQIGQLTALTMAHFCVDMFGGILPAILPLIRKEFSLSIINGVWLLAVAGLFCNGTQIVSGHRRPHRSRPFFLPLGLLGASCVCFLAFLTGTPSAVVWLWLFVVINHIGIGVVHPEGLRGVYALKEIPPALATAVFINGGFFAVGAGAWLSALVVSDWGLRGLLVFLVGPIVCVFLVYALRIRLAVDRKPTESDDIEPDAPESFLAVMMMAVPYAASATILLCLLPTVLVDEIGFEMTFGGFSSMLMVGGGAAGSLLWSALARTRSELWCCTCALLTGLPSLLAYLILIEHKWAVCFLALAACCSLAVFPLIVTLARHARGANLGGRMGWVVGGSWGVGSLVLMVLGPIAERYSVRTVLNLSWPGLALAACCCIVLLRRRKVVA